MNEDSILLKDFSSTIILNVIKSTIFNKFMYVYITLYRTKDGGEETQSNEESRKSLGNKEN